MSDMNRLTDPARCRTASAAEHSTIRVSSLKMTGAPAKGTLCRLNAADSEVCGLSRLDPATYSAAGPASFG